MVKTYYTYDDIQLVPAYSEIHSRSHISLKTKLSTSYDLPIPIVASPMDTVCGYEMAKKMFQLGGIGFIHRFDSRGIQADYVRELVNYVKENPHTDVWGENTKIPIGAAIGVSYDDKKRVENLLNAGVNVILIDVAHGHHIKVKEMVEWLVKYTPEDVDIIAGNIATAQAAKDLEEWGVNGLRVGIGGGSLCTTRTQTGFGVPNVSALEEIVSVASTPVMADGGIRTSGDIVKALALGASTVMLGSLIAGTEEAPGSIVETPQGLYKRYRGSASIETKMANGQQIRNVEGVSTTIPYKGGVKFIINGLLDGIRSGLSYGGAENLSQFHPDYVVVTNSGIIEAKPHLTL